MFLLSAVFRMLLSKRLGIDPKYREIGKSILNSSYVAPPRPNDKTEKAVDHELPNASKSAQDLLLAYEDELIWVWCFKKALLLTQKNAKVDFLSFLFLFCFIFVLSYLTH
jgi:hypothetical protein